jgi:DNA helicase-2/ATP-dependent DNA helicase PcrA
MTESFAQHPILASLNPTQAEAARVVDGPLLVLAGAGSGKTRVITHRIAWLIHSGVHPSAILGVTFTNKAAREMRSRVRALTGRSDVRLHTFHAFCAAFLREEFPTVGRESDFTIYDDQDALVLMKRVITDLSIDPEAHPPQRILNRIGKWKTRLTSPEEAAADLAGTFDEVTARAYSAYDDALKEANACDFDDLLLTAARLLERRDIRDRWQRRITHVLVDEFQDTNPVQYALVRALTESTGNLCVTGDQDQSIYSWRGADPSNFDRFLQDHPSSPIVRLEQNYRSTGFILRAASSVIGHNRHRIPKTLWTEDEDGEPVRVVSFRDDHEEAYAIAHAIREFEAEGFRRESMAVFFRTNALSLSVERALLHEGIPYVVVGGLAFFGRQEVKDLLAYLRFIVNPQDAVSLTRVLNVPPRGIGKKTQEQIIGVARREGIPLGQALRRPELFSDFTARARTAIATFASVLLQVDEVRSKPVSDFILEVISRTGYGDYWQTKATKGGSLDPYQNIGQMVTLAREMEEEPGVDLSAFLTQVALLSDHDRTAPREEAVSLMTLHTSKGLEFDVVFLLGVEKGLLPHIMAAQDPEGEEEERRLFHVGMTRARRRLVITWTGARTRFGRLAPTTASPFLDELGSEGVEHFGDFSLRPGAGFGAMEDALEEEDDDPLQRLRAGAPVWHPEWGSGEVVTIRGRGRGLDRKVTVSFKDDTQRTLILRHSQLEVREEGDFE